MCGIAGIIHTAARVDPTPLKRMLPLLRHRGPDDSDVWSDENAALGHTRLSILDLSQRSRQPMRDPKTGNILVFNGEIYNFQELRAQLEQDGRVFTTSGDSEVLLALYSRHGAQCLKFLRGMFAFAVWEPKARRLFMARDRLGKKPLVYATTAKGLVFASELNALVAHPDISRELNPAALDAFLSMQYIPAPLSIYQHVKKLPPAHYAVFDANGLSIQRYWKLQYTADKRMDQRDAEESIDNALNEAVKLRLISDVPLGGLLSGGVDSSLVAALMARHTSGRIKAFSIGFEESAYNELPHAKAVAQHINAEHHTEIVRMGSLDALPRIANQYGEPFADNSALPTFAVCEMARNNVTVALSGDGGDELACGYTHYRRSRLAAAMQNAFSHAASPPNAATTRLLDGRSLWARTRRSMLYRYIHPELKPLYRIENFQRRDKLALLTPDMVRLNEDALTAWRQELLHNAQEHAHTPIDRMLWIDTNAYLPNDVLVKTDIASMAHSLELRSPLLDHVLIERFAKTPATLKVRPGQTKYLLKKIALKYLPKELVFRRKQGFSTPVSAWFREDLGVLAKETFHEMRPQLAPYVHFNAMETLLNEHRSGRVNHGSRLWVLLTLALWLRSANA